MNLNESHQLARELTMEYIRENRIFSVNESFDNKKRGRDDMVKAYFSLYEDFRNGVEEYAEKYSYGEEMKMHGGDTIIK